jgi:hypothetical protein
LDADLTVTIMEYEGSTSEDVLFDQLVDRFEVDWFRKYFPQVSLPQLVAIFVNAALEALPDVREADEHVRNYFADGFSLALARRFAADRREWLN